MTFENLHSIFLRAYVVNYLKNNTYIDSLPYMCLNDALNDALFNLKTLSCICDQVQIYKNNKLVAELNK